MSKLANLLGQLAHIKVIRRLFDFTLQIILPNSIYLKLKRRVAMIVSKQSTKRAAKRLSALNRRKDFRIIPWSNNRLKVDLVICCAFRGRHEILEKSILESFHGNKGYQIEWFICGSTDEDFQFIQHMAQKTGKVAGMIWNNNPLGEKWHFCVKTAGDLYDADLYAITGSDDILSSTLITNVISKYKAEVNALTAPLSSSRGTRDLPSVGTVSIGGDPSLPRDDKALAGVPAIKLSDASLSSSRGTRDLPSVGTVPIGGDPSLPRDDEALTGVPAIKLSDASLSSSRGTRDLPSVGTVPIGGDPSLPRDDKALAGVPAMYCSNKWYVVRMSPFGQFSSAVGCTITSEDFYVPLGAGRFYTKQFMHQVGYKIFDEQRDNCLDDYGYFKAKELDYRVEHYLPENGLLLSVKGNWNQMNQVEDIIKADSITMDDFTFSMLDAFQKEISPELFHYLFDGREARETYAWA